MPWYDRFRTKAVNASVPGADLVVATTEEGRPVSAPFDFEFARRLTVKANSTVSACADFYARNLSEPPLMVHDGDEPQPLHPLSRIFASPNPFYSQDELWQEVVYNLCDSAQGAYILAPLSRAGEPLALWPKSADDVRIVPSRESFISHYEQRVGTSDWRVIDPDQIAVIRFRFVDPANKWGSWSPVERVKREIRIDSNIGRWIDYALRNMGKTSTAIGIDGLTDQDVADRIRDYLNENIMRAHNAEKALVVAGRVSKFDIGAKWSDLDFGALEDRIEVATARGFGLAPELVHILASTTAGNGLGGERQSALKRQAYTDTLIPISKMLAAKVASVFAPIYDLDPEDVRFDYSGVQAMQEDIDALYNRAKAGEAFLKVDEQRAIVGEAPLEGGAGDFVPRVAQVRYFTAPPEASKAIESKARVIASIEDVANRYEPKMLKAARKVFGAQRKAVLAALDEVKTNAVGLETKDPFDALLDKLEEAMTSDWETEFGKQIGRASCRERV